VPFITFEGVEGCGKSTQLRLLNERFRAAGRDVRATREPGGTPLGERLRALLLDGARAAIDPIAEWLLFEADRRQHLAEVIRPALAAGAWILCDRFSDSTEAYQSAGRGLDAEFIEAVDGRVRDGVRPDLTLLYDLDVAEGLARTRRRDAREDRFESEELAFHERVRRRFLEIARREPGRVVVVPAHGDVAAVFAETSRIVAERFAR
jgi:dTMP kinase